MKIGIVGDIHWSTYSSIVRSRGEKYSTRLENCISSVLWAEETLKSAGCNIIVYLGDFFDSPELNAEEITAIKEVSNAFNSGAMHYFLVGNHEMGLHDLSYNSTNVFSCMKSIGMSRVIRKPESFMDRYTEIMFLPYILEDERKSLVEYCSLDRKFNNIKNRIIFSHNDISGAQMGSFISKNGFSVDEINDNCELFINGHLHNGGKLGDKIINLGNLTGQNFSENASKFDHCIGVLDTDNLSMALYENPFAFNFYPIDTTKESFNFNTLKNNSVVSMKVSESNYNYYTDKLDKSDKIIASRIMIQPDNSDNSINNNKEELSVNHLDEFANYVINNLGNSETVIQELDEVVK